MFDLKSYLQDVRKQVDEALVRYLGGSSPPTRIMQAMAYSVTAGGKRLRPVLCIAAAEAVGGKRTDVLPLACALELIHTYSLIHDDLPAMDDDHTRRGNPTCHVQYDEPTAILAGDALLTLAFEILATAGIHGAPENRQKWLRVIAQVASAAGFSGMIEGQMRDMAFEGTAIPERELKSLHRLKTGKMIEVSIGSGAIMAGSSPVEHRALLLYARHIGLAFQVADDILNVKGDPRKLGKAIGTDQRRGKNTYPSLLGLAGAEAFAGQLVNDAVKALDAFDNDADSLRSIARYVIDRNR
jgi:geranylgeranyl diphosphate synthase type II